MIKAQYGGVGQVCPQFVVEVLPDGQLTSSDSLYFSFQLENRAGFNIPSVSGAIAYTTGQKIRVTIPTTIGKPGWDIHYYYISAGATPDPTTHVQLARVPGYQLGTAIERQTFKTVLPTSIDFSHDTLLAFAPSIPTTSDLPTGLDRLDGMVRRITADGNFLEYRADSIDPPGVNVIIADIGRWVQISNSSTYIGNTELELGSDRPITEIDPTSVIQPPLYPGQAAGNNKALPGWEVVYWIYNNDTFVLSAGTEFGIELKFNDKRSINLLNGLFQIRFLGYVQSNGAIRTQTSNGIDFPNIGAYFTWTPNETTPFITPDDLQPQEAIALGVKPFFSPAELNNQITPGSVITAIPSIRTQSGDYNPLGKLIPRGAVYSTEDKYRIVPNLGLSYDILAGNALIASYDFPVKPQRTYGGLAPNTPGQKVIINGNGAVFIQPPIYQPTASEALRALVGTIAGESSAALFSQPKYTGNTASSLAITVNYPCNLNGDGIVRNTYTDTPLIGNTQGAFNPNQVNIYIRNESNGEIRKFTGFIVIPSESQNFILNDWQSGTVVNALFINVNPDFSLYSPGSATFNINSSQSGNFLGTYSVSYSFYYDGTSITSISHASPPCITELEGDFSPPAIAVGTVTTLEPGFPATVTNVSHQSNLAIFNFGIPRNAPLVFTLGTVKTVPAGFSAKVTNVGTSIAPILNFELPQGEEGTSEIIQFPQTLSITNGIANADLSTSNRFILNLITHVTFFSATNLRPGQFIFYLIEDITGNKNLTFDTNIFKFPDNGVSTIDTGTIKYNKVVCDCDGSKLYCEILVYS